jgi:lipopolysaccharide export LptBFGC system permease protein LptF
VSTPRRISWPVLVVALLCLVPVAAGVLLLLSGSQGSHALGFALVGFFGAGTFVLGRKAFSGS